MNNLEEINKIRSNVQIIIKDYLKRYLIMEDNQNLNTSKIRNDNNEIFLIEFSNETYHKQKYIISQNEYVNF
jgi:hypothetical protein